MGIQQNHQSYSTWVTTLLSAVSVNFAIDKNFRCNAYFEDSENIAKAVFAKLITEKFGENYAIAEIAKLWPSNSYGSLMALPSLDSKRTRVKIKLIQNYFKFYSA